MYIIDGQGDSAYLGGLGKMTPEQEALHKEVKQFFKAQRKSVKGHKARVAAGVNKKTQRQTLKALKQAYDEGLPIDVLSPLVPSSPVVPGYPGSKPSKQPPSTVPTIPKLPGVPSSKAGGVAKPKGTATAQAGGISLEEIAPFAAAAAALFLLS